jgi:hypothetical protein
VSFLKFVSGTRVAVIGPAPTIIGSNQSKSLESYDLIVRLNKAVPVPKEIIKDTGSRTDIICNCLEPMERSGGHLNSDIWKNNGVKWVLSAYPLEVWFNKTHATNFLKRNNNKLPVEFPPIDKYTEFQNKLGTRPNSGICSIWHLLNMPTKEVYVTGFTFGRGGYHKGYCDSVSPESYEKSLANGPNHKQEPQRLYFKEWLKKEPRLKVDEPMRKIIEE